MRKVEISVSVAQDLIKLAVANERYDFIEILAKAINDLSAVNVVVKAAPKTTVVKKKRGRKAKSQSLPVVDVSNDVQQSEESTVVGKTTEEAKAKKREYMRKFREKKAHKNDA